MRLAFAVLFLLLGEACAARRTGEDVRDVRFVFEDSPTGLARLGRRPSQRAIRNAMAHPQPATIQLPWAPERVWLDRDTLDEDAWRIEIWYVNQGYFDARVLGWEVVPRRRPLERAWWGGPPPVPKVIVRGHVREGQPSHYRKIDIQGIDKLGRPLQRRIRELLGDRAAAGIAIGDEFNYATWEETLGALRTMLQERSYAHARVTGALDVYPEDHAVDARVDVETGPACRFGEIRLDGLVKVPEAVVREQLTFDSGESFSASALAETRGKLYALRVFGVVDILPDLSEPSSSIVPVRIRFTEAKPREVRAGPVFQFEPGKASIAVRGLWQDNNVANRLWRMEQEASVGAGVIVPSALKSWEPAWSDVKPIVDVRGVVELPHLFGARLALLNSGRVEVGLEPGYRSFSPSFSPSLVYTGFERLRPSIGYTILYRDYFDLTIDLEDIEDASTGVDITDPYLLSMLEQKLTWDARNDPAATTRGWYGSLAVAEAGGLLGGNYSFIRALGELRAYRGVVDLFGWDPDLVFAGRIGGGVILPYGPGEEASVPLAERLYLGGTSTVRGWGADRLGPWVCTPTEEGAETPDEETCLTTFGLQVPVGGELQLFGNLEVRKGLPLDLVGAVFVDVGRTWDRPARFNFGELRWSVGGGLRYPTPVGPIRLDVGVRLGEEAYFQAQPRWTLHLGLGEAF